MVPLTTSSTTITFPSTKTWAKTIVEEGLTPSFDNLAASSVVTGRVSEVQSITVNTSDGLIFGGFNLDFNNSGIPLYFRADESAKDMEYKLESLPTVGDVTVTRTTRVHNSNILAGYEWLVTFNSDEGDLPLASVRQFSS